MLRKYVPLIQIEPVLDFITKLNSRMNGKIKLKKTSILQFDSFQIILHKLSDIEFHLVYRF